MIEALYYEKIRDKVRCNLCPNFCFISVGEFGKCNARKNVDGKLIAWTYGKVCSMNVDPVEKKPLFHFHSGERAFSISTSCCHLHCKFCQNWEISQKRDVPFQNMSAKEVVQKAKKERCKMIAYTYTEPTVYYEFVLDCAKLARKEGLYNITVTNGFVNKAPLKRLYKYIDAANVDLKGFNDKFYREICGARLEPVLESIKEIYKMGIWLELTNLIIPGHNDDFNEIKKMCEWIKNLDSKIPVHFSRFFPMYKMKEVEITPLKTLQKAKKIAEEVGLKKVYIGNV